MPIWTQLKLPGQIGSAQLTDQLQTNLTAFLDWALLGIGGFLNVTLDNTAPFGGNPSTLRLSDDFRYPKGMVWDGFKTNWVWETNTDYNPQPIQISGIYINNTFYPTGVNAAYNIDYPDGRIFFNSPIATNSVVQVEYSYKYFNIYPASVQWFQQLTERTFRIDDPQFNQYGSGIWSTFPVSRAQLPAIVIEPVPRRTWLGKGLGGGQWIYTDVLFHVFAEDPYTRNNMVDILTYQNEKKFFFFDKNITAQSGAFPLSPSGFLVNPNSTYPNLVNSFLWRYCIIRNTTAYNMNNEPQSIYRGISRWTMEVDMPEI